MINTKSKRIIVDADACPSLHSMIKIARIHNIHIVLVGNETQNLNRFRNSTGISIQEVACTPDAADYAIVSLVMAGDIVITEDIGLASLALSKKALVISARGKTYHEATIEYELILRHEGQKVRRAGGRTKGPAAYTSEDKERFCAVLKALLK